jgi:hypothetical protein
MLFLAPEDCGSWVVDATSHSFLGIVNSSREHLARVLPAYKIFEAEGHKVNLPPEEVTSEARPSSRATKPRPRSLSRETNLPFFLENILWNNLKTPLRYRRDSFKAGAPLCRSNNKQFIWEMAMEGEAGREWETLERNIKEIVKGTLPKSNTLPSIALYGFMVGKDVKHAFPSVAIDCDDHSYAVQLRDAICRSKVLDDTYFKVTVLDESPKRLTESPDEKLLGPSKSVYNQDSSV